MTRKLIPESFFKLSPLVVDIDSIVDVYVPYVASSVIHNIESRVGPHDLLRVFNTSHCLVCQ